MVQLLESDLFFTLLRDPSELRRRVLALPPGWVVIDEVQKLPLLLDDVHALLSERPTRYKFALTGSSARKLKRGQANLLAGRAVNRSMFSLTLNELEDSVPVTELLRFGGLPAVSSYSARTACIWAQRRNATARFVSCLLRNLRAPWRMATCCSR